MEKSCHDIERDTLNALGERSLTVVELQHCYGALRDRFVADVKPVLNSHYHEAGVVKIARVLHLLSNRGSGRAPSRY